MTLQLSCLLLVAGTLIATAIQAQSDPITRYATGIVIPPNWNDSHVPKLGKISPEAAANLPAVFDSRQKWPYCADVIGRVDDQAMCGSCWAFGTVGAIESRICIQSKGTYKPYLSVEDLLECSHEEESRSSNAGCSGGWPLKAYEHYVKRGIVTGGPFGSGIGCKPYFYECKRANPPEQNCPYLLGMSSTCQEYCENNLNKNYVTQSEEVDRQIYKKDLHRGASYNAVPPDVATIKAEIFNYGPVTATIAIDKSIYGYTNGTFCIAGPDRHAVRIIGWGIEKGVHYWQIVNSWGTRWGEQGMARIQEGCMLIETQIASGLPMPKFY